MWTRESFTTGPGDQSAMETKPSRVAHVCEVHGGPLPADLAELPALLADAMAEFAEETREAGGAMPAEFTAWDAAAWKRLQADLGPLGNCTCTEETPLEWYFNGGAKEACLCNWMLMHHVSDTRAAFKNSSTRRYRFA